MPCSGSKIRMVLYNILLRGSPIVDRFQFVIRGTGKWRPRELANVMKFMTALEGEPGYFTPFTIDVDGFLAFVVIGPNDFLALDEKHNYYEGESYGIQMEVDRNYSEESVVSGSDSDDEEETLRDFNVKEGIAKALKDFDAATIDSILGKTKLTADQLAAIEKYAEEQEAANKLTMKMMEAALKDASA